MGKLCTWMLAGLLGLTACATGKQLVKVLDEGEERTLRPHSGGEALAPAEGSPLLILAIDGVDRDLLYTMLELGELPELGALLGQTADGFPHAYFAPDVLTTLPSTTGVAWATFFTGVPPAEHGFMGNEFFVRESREFAAPIPVSVHASAEALKVYTEGYANRFLEAPTIYESMRAREPGIEIWVSMSQFYAGADRFLMTRRSVLGVALEEMLSGHTSQNIPRTLWQDLDKADVAVVIDELRTERVPDVLTIYLFGTDEWAHIAPEGPYTARTNYLRNIIDPQIGKLRRRLAERDALRDRLVVVVSDHGHTAVVSDADHALATDDHGDPPALLRRAGFRVRPFEDKVDAKDGFQSVLAYEGALAYVYLADRSSCPGAWHACDWSRPPRWDEDVVPAAEAFYQNNLDGRLVPAMKGTLDLILTRRPVPIGDSERPYEVYVGHGQTEPIASYLSKHPHPTYLAVASRIRELSEGRHGERAGDVLLLAHNGDREEPEDRYYFARPWRSWHGSPSAEDSRVPLIVAHPQQSSAELARRVRPLLGAEPRPQNVGAMLVGLRAQPAH